jgi:hypothetical protein
MTISYKGTAGAIAIASASRGSGTYTSGLLNNADLDFAAVELLVYASAVSGSPSLVCSLESSSDHTNWTAVPGATTTALTAPGSVVINAAIANANDDLRVTSTVSGSGSPTITYRVAVFVLAAS